MQVKKQKKKPSSLAVLSAANEWYPTSGRIQVSDVVDGMIREYLVRNKCAKTSKAFAVEKPSHAKVSERVTLWFAH